MSLLVCTVANGSTYNMEIVDSVDHRPKGPASIKSAMETPRVLLPPSSPKFPTVLYLGFGFLDPGKIGGNYGERSSAVPGTWG